MPVVPKYDRQVASTALPGARVNPNVPIEAFGGGKAVEEAGRAATGLVDSVEKFALDEKRKADEIAIQDADTQASQLQVETQLGAQTDYRGEAAAGAIDYAKQNWSDGAQKIRDSLSNDEQRRAFDKAAGNRWESLNKAVQFHAYQETQAYDADSTNAAVKATQNEAITNYQDLGTINNSVARQAQTLAEYAGRTGMDKTMLAEKQLEAESTLHTGVLSRMLDNGQIDAARAYFASLKANSNIAAPAGLVESGNIDLTSRPRVKNADGSISTVRSVGVNVDGEEVLIPTVSPDGKILTTQQAVDLYKESGQHLGKFETPEDSTAYALNLHDQQEKGLKVPVIGRLTGADADNVEKRIQNGEVITRGMALYNQLRGLTFEDGTPNEAAMRNAVWAQKNTPDAEKEKLWEFVKGRAAEDVANRSRENLARDNAFMNEILTAKNKGATMEQELTTLNAQFAKPGQTVMRDEKDRASREAAIRKLYAPPTDSDPKTFISLWQQAREGKATIDDIDAASTKGQLKLADWRLLREEQFNALLKEKDPEVQANWKRIEALADEKFPGQKVAREQFMYEIISGSKGKKPEELWKSANDKLKGDPNTGVWGFFQTKQFKTDLQKMDAENLAWGNVASDIGGDEMKAIRKGLSRGGKPATPADFDAFTKAMGGYDKMKPGTPVHNAIQSIIRNSPPGRAGIPVTPSNIQKLLSIHPDGNWNGK